MPQNKYTVYDCEFRTRLSSKLVDKWWKYGESSNETKDILQDVFATISNEGEAYFSRFRDFPKPFLDFDILSIQNVQNVMVKFGSSTEVRMALVLARIYTYIGNYEIAYQWISYGSHICKGKTVLSKLFNELHTTRIIYKLNRYALK